MAVIVELPLRVEGELGTVVARVVVTNHEDEINARSGAIQAEQIRSVDLSNVLVDTGATTLCLPLSIVEALGLPLKRKVIAVTAGGEVETGIYQEANIQVAGRSAVVECLALPEGTRPLLGVIPMEIMGLEPDLQKEILRVLPDDNKDTYILAY